MSKPQVTEVDRFALLSALFIHHIGGGDCDALDLRQFPILVIRVFRKAVVVARDRFDNNNGNFYTVMLTRVFLAKIENDIDMLAIEQWLDVELREAGLHPRHFN